MVNTKFKRKWIEERGVFDNGMGKDDKLICGIKAGLIGCLIKDLLTAFVKFVLKGKPTYWDYGEYLVFQKLNSSSTALMIGLLMEVMFGVFLAIGYVHLKHLIKTNHPLLRGFIFGISIWFGSRCLITMDHVKILVTNQMFMVPINLLIAGIYGLVVSYAIEKSEQNQV